MIESILVWISLKDMVVHGEHLANSTYYFNGSFTTALMDTDDSSDLIAPDTWWWVFGGLTGLVGPLTWG